MDYILNFDNQDNVTLDGAASVLQNSSSALDSLGVNASSVQVFGKRMNKTRLTLSLPSSKSGISPNFQRESEVVRIGGIITFYLSKR